MTHTHICSCGQTVTCCCEDRRDGERRTLPPIKCIDCIKQEEDELVETLADA
jgi:hypothetical protein